MKVPLTQNLLRALLLQNLGINSEQPAHVSQSSPNTMYPHEYEKHNLNKRLKILIFFKIPFGYLGFTICFLRLLSLLMPFIKITYKDFKS